MNIHQQAFENEDNQMSLVLDYEAEEKSSEPNVIATDHASRDNKDMSCLQANDKSETEMKDAKRVGDDVSKVKNTASGEVEDGELSDDEIDSPKKPKDLTKPAVCRFYVAGGCRLSTNCRFEHPMGLKYGRYSMFGSKELNLTKSSLPLSAVEHTNIVHKTIPSILGNDAIYFNRLSLTKFDTAWEKGLKRAKELKMSSTQRKKADKSEYEERRDNLTLAQADLEIETDYCIRQSSPDRDFKNRTINDGNESYSILRERSSRYSSRNYKNHSLKGFRDNKNYDDSQYSRTRYSEPESRSKYEYHSPEFMNRRYSTKRRMYSEQSIETSKNADDWEDPWMRSKAMRNHDKVSLDSINDSTKRHSSPDSSYEKQSSQLGDAKAKRARSRSYSSGSNHSSTSSERGKIEASKYQKSRRYSSYNNKSRSSRRSSEETSSGSTPSPIKRRNTSPDNNLVNQSSFYDNIERTRSRTPIMKTFSSEGTIIHNDKSDRLKDKSKVEIKLSPSKTDSSRLSSTEEKELADSNSKQRHDHRIKEKIKSEPELYNNTPTERLINRSTIPSTSLASSDYEYNAPNNKDERHLAPLKLVINKTNGTVSLPIKKEPIHSKSIYGSAVDDPEGYSSQNSISNATISKPFVDYRQNSNQSIVNDVELNIKKEHRTAADRRYELLQQLQDVENSITKKRNQILH